MVWRTLIERFRIKEKGIILSHPFLATSYFQSVI